MNGLFKEELNIAQEIRVNQYKNILSVLIYSCLWWSCLVVFVYSELSSASIQSLLLLDPIVPTPLIKICLENTITIISLLKLVHMIITYNIKEIKDGRDNNFHVIFFILNAITYNNFLKLIQTIVLIVWIFEICSNTIVNFYYYYSLISFSNKS